MARTDRLMRLMDILRRLPKPVTAARLARESGVSQRQLYRDIATLRAGGALIDGEAGLGYTLTEDPALPPQSFSRIEIEALRLAVESLGRIGDTELNAAGRNAMARIIATLPERQARQALHGIMRVNETSPDRVPPQVDLAVIRDACWEEAALEIDYTDLKGAASRRVIWPLGLSYSQQALMLLAYCRLRMDFRIFHVNRIAAVRPNGESFRPRRVSLVREYVLSCRHRPHRTASAVILAGGRASRMGGCDKGMLPLAGQPMLERVIARIRPQSERLALNSNRDQAGLAMFGLPVLKDDLPGFAGPLAGVLTAMIWADAQNSSHVLTVPVDIPFLPHDLGARLAKGAGADGLALAASRDGAGIRLHPTVALWPVRLVHDLRSFLLAGNRKVRDFTAGYKPEQVIWERDPVDPFLNINTPEDLRFAESLLNES